MLETSGPLRIPRFPPRGAKRVDVLIALLIPTALAVLATGILWVGSGLLESASENLAAYYALPSIVQGSIVVAVGSSFPELSTTVLSTLVHGEFELGMSAIVGSAIFNVLVIPALSGLASENPMPSNRDLVYKEAQFYMIAVAVLLITFSFAAIFNPVSGSERPILGQLDRPLALMPVALYGLYLFVQYHDTMDHDSSPDASIRPLWEWGRLVVSLLLILVGVEMLLRAALRYGELLETPSLLWGMTVVAMGTSAPDALLSIRMARSGRGITSLANVLGSNVFDLLVCIPAGVLVAGSTTVNFSVAAPLMGILTFATIILFGLMRTSMELSDAESVFLLVVYGAIVLWVGLESVGWMNLVLALP